MAEESVKDMIFGMEKSFVPAEAEGLDAVIQYHFTGEDAMELYVVIKDKTCKVMEGTHENPTLAFTSTAADYKLMGEGKLDGMKAFLTKRLVVKGDMKLAAKMQKLFP
jgi:putative sterol carrier protein